MQIFKVCALLFLVSFATIAQPVKINIENSPSKIIQQNPKIWRLDQERLLVTWEDYRNGTKNIYGQILDFNLSKYGKNFPQHGQDAIFGLKDSRFLAIKIFHTYYEFDVWSYGITDFIGRLYRNERPLSEPTNYFSYSTGPCGTGFIGFALNAIAFEDQYLFWAWAGSLDDVVFTADYYTYEGNKIRTFTHYADDFPGILMTAESFDGDLALIWLERIFNYGDSLPRQKLIFETFDQKDTRLDSIVLDDFGPIENLENFYLDSKLTSKKINDSTLVIAFWDARDGTLNLYTPDSDGSEVFKQQKRITWEKPYALQEIFIKSGRTQNAVVKLYLRRFGEPIKYLNYFYYLDENGNLNGDSLVIVRTDKLLHPDLVLYVRPDSFLVTEENENDIFLKPTHNFEGNDKIKLNDDLIGSNEQAGAVIIKNEESVLITYQDEIGNWGRSVYLEGNLSVNELALPSTDGEFFNDGAFLSFWKQGKKAGFSVFDEFFNVLTTKSILEVVDYAWSLQTAGKIINDSTFLQVAAHGGRVYLYLFDRQGRQKMATDFPFENFLDTLSLKFANDGSFWCIGEYELQKFSSELQPLSERIHFGERIETVLGEKILTYPWSSKNTGNLFSIDQDTLTKNIEMAPAGNTRSAAITLPGEQFFICYVSDHQLRFRRFNENGQIIRDGLILTDSIALHNAKRIKINMANNKVFLTWSAIPGNNSGFDVYALHIPLVLITSLPEQKIKPVESFLLANYPNPFNGQTTLQLFIPHKTKVDLSIYDLLGKKVRQLISNKNIQGKIEFVWDGLNDSGLPVASGIYWCKLQTAKQTVWHKLVLVK
ncbi:MAG: T9SS type A sorting domain-containing protein [Caldisericaceae bacterium]|nr:T9SS type A sorting domain-containing protein [Caldisericaceae bacterium]